MFEIKPFSEDYIDDATKLFAAYYENNRSLQPLLPEKNVLHKFLPLYQA